MYAPLNVLFPVARFHSWDMFLHILLVAVRLPPNAGHVLGGESIHLWRH